MGSKPKGRALDVGVDLDGCVYPFVEVLRDWVHVDTGRPLDTLPTPTCWHFFEEQWGYRPGELLLHVERGVNAGVIFHSGLPIPGSIRALHQIAEERHRIHIVTARFAPGAETSVADSTRWWLKTYDVPYTSLTISADKSVVDTDVFIDDSPANYAALEAAGANPRFFHQTWNADVPGRRIYAWAAFRDVVQELAHRSVR
jgi:5'(3')-deoxyribonucleotidase